MRDELERTAENIRIAATERGGDRLLMDLADQLEALAARVGEPVAEILVGINGHIVDVKRQKKDLAPGFHSVYLAAPQPATVPDSLPRQEHETEFESCWRHGWNACRAAMLAASPRAAQG